MGARLREAALLCGALIYRLGFDLRMRDAVKLFPYHGATLYALLCAAWSEVTGQAPSLPDGVMVDAPEQLRVDLSAGEPYRFGLTMVAYDHTKACGVLRTLVQGISLMSRVRADRMAALAGNYEVAAVADMFAGRALDRRRPEPLPEGHVLTQCRQLEGRRAITLRFLTPYRAYRPDSARTAGHELIDAGYFNASLFARRLESRLARLNVSCPVVGECHTLVNRLVWYDMLYGPARRRKTIGGAMGRVVITGSNPQQWLAFVLGQYLRVGQNTRFGFGAYRIEELEPDPAQITRSVSLLDLAVREAAHDLADADAPSGELAAALQRIRESRYQPDRPAVVAIEKPEGGQRTLAVPAATDRALQRLVLRRLAPAIDQVLDESSYAYRANLGRRTAAYRIRDAVRSGYRYALKSDFARFFESVSHDVLRDRIDAIIGDDRLSALLMKWVGAAGERGLPVGAPISPVLANLVLDQFDDEVGRQGGLLVRYADDWMILLRDKASAERMLEHAAQAARRLELALNQAKTRSLDLREPFEFLGYRFALNGRWEMTGSGQLQRVSDLSWQEQVPAVSEAPALPGETGEAEVPDGAWLLIGPRARQVRLDGSHIRWTSEAGLMSTPVSISDIREIIAIGPPDVSAELVRRCARDQIRLLLTDDNATTFSTIAPGDIDFDADTVAAQVRLREDSGWRLATARRLISAKIGNYASLARMDAARTHDHSLADGLEELAERAAHAESTSQLLGHEGVAAARWYNQMAGLLPAWMRFGRRVAPNAGDPGNVLLNLAQAMLHRQVCVALRGAGLVPTVGILHENRTGHAALASNFQEPFRHLMDRAVIFVARQLRPTDFQASEHGPYRLRIAPGALRRTLAVLHQTFARVCVGGSDSQPRSYLAWIHLLSRSFRLHLRNRSHLPVIFRHIAAEGGSK